MFQLWPAIVVLLAVMMSVGAPLLPQCPIFRKSMFVHTNYSRSHTSDDSYEISFLYRGRFRRHFYFSALNFCNSFRTYTGTLGAAKLYLFFYRIRQHLRLLLLLILLLLLVNFLNELTMNRSER